MIISTYWPCLAFASPFSTLYYDLPFLHPFQNEVRKQSIIPEIGETVDLHQPPSRI